MTEERLNEIEARHHNSQPATGREYTMLGDIADLILEVRRLNDSCDAGWARFYKAADEKMRLSEENDRLREALAAMTNERNQWREEASPPAGAGPLLPDWSEPA